MTAEQDVRNYIDKKIDKLMRKANRALRKHKDDPDYESKVASDKNRLKAKEYCDLLRKQNLLDMKEKLLADMTRFIKERGLYEGFCHWEYADEESDLEDVIWY
jgi:hypothetical protein